MVRFQIGDINVKENIAKTLFSFKLIDESNSMEFTPMQCNDLFIILKILKTKMKLGGFHDFFRQSKKMGKGSFENVKKKIFYNDI